VFRAGKVRWERKGEQARDLPAFAESPVRKGGDECEKGIHRSLLTAIASAAGVGEGGSASAGSAEDVKMPCAAARGASLRGGVLSEKRRRTPSRRHLDFYFPLSSYPVPEYRISIADIERWI